MPKNNNRKTVLKSVAVQMFESDGIVLGFTCGGVLATETGLTPQELRDVADELIEDGLATVNPQTTSETLFMVILTKKGITEAAFASGLSVERALEFAKGLHRRTIETSRK